MSSSAVVRDGRLRPWFVVTLATALVVAAGVALVAGRFPLGVSDIVAAFAGRLGGPPAEHVVDSVIFGLRLPRLLLAVLIGAGLAASGAAFQSLFSNPLATPDTLGVTAGASVGAVLAMVVGANMLGVQLAALAAGVGSVVVTMAISRTQGRTSIVMLVLSGVVVAAIANSILAILKFTADPNEKLPQITYWLLGSLSGASFDSLAIGAPLVAVGIIVIVLMRWRLNVLALSDDEARAAGINLRLMRPVVIGAATLITASVVSMCGQVGWVGLLIPHCARMLCGNNNRYIIPVSVLLGAVFVLVIDTLARSVTAAEIPISVLTALVGAPFFIVLLRQTGGRWA